VFGRGNGGGWRFNAPFRFGFSGVNVIDLTLAGVLTPLFSFSFFVWHFDCSCF
jgi:hypothetical protein